MNGGGAKAPLFLMNFIFNDYVLEKHLRIVIGTFFVKPDLSKKTLIRFRCNICGDSKTNKFKQRGYLLYRDNPKKKRKTWQFYCHNCGKSMNAEYWMKLYFPTNYKSYISELLSNKEDDESKIKWKKIEIKKKEEIKKEKENIKRKELKDVKFFEPLCEHNSDENNMFGAAINFCKNRGITQDVWSTWFFATDGKYKNRLIIPFFNKDENIYYWQGRALLPYMLPKYLNRQENRDEAVYGIYNIDKTRPVTVLEGPIDSIFVENSIATLGTNIPEKVRETLKGVDCHYLFDNDKAGMEKAYQYLLEGKSVFLWQTFLKSIAFNGSVKDINDLVLNFPKIKNHLSYEALNQFFTTSIFDKIYLTGGY